MTRKEFLKICGLLGVGLPLQTTLASCQKDSIETNFEGKVIIIGAGAGGLTAGYLLNQQGIDFEILEASANYGGRMKRTLDFANFPIPLGAEWLHVGRDIFGEIINDSAVQFNINTTPYNPSTDSGLFEGEQISLSDIGLIEDQKFINATWFDFFEQYIVPSVADKISYNTIVNAIDYSGEKIKVQSNQRAYEADRVIVSIPIKMLQNKAITFSPALPNDKQEAINQVTIWDGFKAFIEFSEKFYPTFIGFDISPESAGQKLYYDASYGQNTSQHILGLFTVGTGTQPYIQLQGDALIQYMLKELDDIFEGQASKNYINHTAQNWNAEPFINGAYITDHENWRRLRTLGESVGEKLFFAGDAYTTGEDWSSVHAAARSAKRAVAELVS